MGVTFRDESNEPSFIMIVYSDATVTALNHPLIVRSKTSLARALLQYHSCVGNFVIRLYLIPLINGQNIVSLSSKYFHPSSPRLRKPAPDLLSLERPARRFEFGVAQYSRQNYRSELF